MSNWSVSHFLTVATIIFLAGMMIGAVIGGVVSLHKIRAMGKVDRTRKKKLNQQNNIGRRIFNHLEKVAGDCQIPGTGVARTEDAAGIYCVYVGPKSKYVEFSKGSYFRPGFRLVSICISLVHDDPIISVTYEAESRSEAYGVTDVDVDKMLSDVSAYLN
jgi:hypothetical protein